MATKTVYTASGSSVVIQDTAFASGGEGEVYRVLSSAFSDCCAKIYLQHKRTGQRRQKIEFMIRNKPATLTSSYYTICWPIQAIFDHNKFFIGFIMPMAFTGSEQLFALTMMNLSPRLGSQWNKFERVSTDGFKNRMKICVNIAAAIHMVHQTKQYTVVDYKPQNILVAADGKVSLIDIDSIQIASNNTVLYHAEVSTPEYSPPESLKLNPSKNFIPENWDRFSLAVSFYELMFGIHPYVATCDDGQYKEVNTIGEKIQKGLFVYGSKKVYLAVIPPPHKGFTILSPVMVKLFVNAFESGNSNPDLRPSAEQWGSTIWNELQNPAITPPSRQFYSPPKQSQPVVPPRPASFATSRPSAAAQKKNKPLAGLFQQLRDFFR